MAIMRAMQDSVLAAARASVADVAGLTVVEAHALPGGARDPAVGGSAGHVARVVWDGSEHWALLPGCTLVSDAYAAALRGGR